MLNSCIQSTNRKRRALPSQERLRELFDYDPDGFLVWRETPGKRKRTVGARAGGFSVRPTERRRLIMADGVQYIASRLIWKWHHGFDPDVIDHINGEASDDRIENLRNCAMSGNCKNRKGHAASGLKGAHISKNGRYHSVIKSNGKALYLGRFKTPEEAHAAYVAAAEKLHGEFACTRHRSSP